MTQKIAKPVNRKAGLYAGAALLVAAFLAGMYWWAARTPRSGGPLEKVTIAASIGYAGTCPVFAAREKGYFADEGIALAIEPHTAGKAALAKAGMLKVPLKLTFTPTGGKPRTKTVTFTLRKK